MVYPVDGFYINDVPHVPHECDDPFCVESGAFTTESPPVIDQLRDGEPPPDRDDTEDTEETPEEPGSPAVEES
jgi:hypothetical protein